MSLGQRKCLTARKDKFKQKRFNYFKVINFEEIISGYTYLNFAVMKDTALGSGNVLGIQLHNCHINLELENNRLKFSRSKTF